MDKNFNNFADSAGQPWGGREFVDNFYENDSGRIFPEVADKIKSLSAGEIGEASFIATLAKYRVLLPLVSALDGKESLQIGDFGLPVDKSSNLAVAKVAAADGRIALPVFSDTKYLESWSGSSRCIPIDMVRVALAVVQEDTSLIVLDPGTEHVFVVRRPAVWCIAQRKVWIPAYEDTHLIARIVELSLKCDNIVNVEVKPGSGVWSGKVFGGGSGPELCVILYVVSGLSADIFEASIRYVQSIWVSDILIADMVDSFEIKIVSA